MFGLSKLRMAYSASSAREGRFFRQPGVSASAEETRLWRLANASEVRITDETFERHPNFDLRRYAKQSFGTYQERPVQVALRFSPKAARDTA